MKRRAWSRAVAFALYLILMSSIVVSLVASRRWALEQMTSAAAQDDWNDWRDDVAERRDPQSASVTRRVPKSTEPPVVVLMRDYFMVCLAGAVGFSSLLYGAITWLLLGALAQREPA